MTKIAAPGSVTTLLHPTPGPVLALKQLVARLQRENSKIQELLASLSFALRTLNNVNQFFELIPLVTSRVTEADATALVLFRADGQVRLEQLHCHASDQCPNIRSALETATRTLANGLAHVDPDHAQESLENQLDAQLTAQIPSGIRFFGTSILVKESPQRARGRLYIFSQSPEYNWTETRQHLMQVIADQTAMAIANDELAIQLRERQRRDRELEIGAEIQKNLLPTHCPDIAGLELAAACRTASWVGGDYYDFIPITYGQGDHQDLARGRWGIAVGDVMGKGVPAGLIMTMTRGMLRAEALNGHRPSRIMQHLNRAMQPDLENSHRFVTLFYSEYNPQTRILSYSNAAHLPPLLWQAKTQSVRRLDTYGMLIGLDGRAQYQEVAVQLEIGDRIIFYTDGITEAENSANARFEESRLQVVLAQACQLNQTAEQILEFIFSSVTEFVSSTSREQDDMTLIVLAVNG